MYPCNAYNYLFSMKKIDRILPGETGNMDGKCRAGMGSKGLKIPVRQFHRRVIFIPCITKKGRAFWALPLH
jgi:hypothetical protein